MKSLEYIKRLNSDDPHRFFLEDSAIRHGVGSMVNVYFTKDDYAKFIADNGFLQNFGSFVGEIECYTTYTTNAPELFTNAYDD